MKKTVFTLILIVIILATAAYIYKSSDPVNTPKVSEETETVEEDTQTTNNTTRTETNTTVVENRNEPVVSNVNLEGTTFRMTSFDGEEIPRGSNYTLTFSDGRISAKICNNMGGAYTLQNGVLKSEQMISTMMYCGSPDNLMKIEDTFGKGMADGMTFSLSGSNLVLVSEDGKMLTYTVFMD